MRLLIFGLNSGSISHLKWHDSIRSLVACVLFFLPYPVFDGEFGDVQILDNFKVFMAETFEVVVEVGPRRIVQIVSLDFLGYEWINQFYIVISKVVSTVSNTRSWFYRSLISPGGQILYDSIKTQQTSFVIFDTSLLDKLLSSILFWKLFVYSFICHQAELCSFNRLEVMFH